jgi:predicted AAA+ superfamily ATPase
MWIERDISQALTKNSSPIQVLRGPRQCGKSSLILKLDPSFKELSLDDLSLRQLAQSDPELFLKQFQNEKLFIDEAQYAPALFPALKRRVDLYKRNSARPFQTILRLTGSNQILMDRHVKESLAGRASFFDLNTLSVAELQNGLSPKPLIQDLLYRGGWPEIHAQSGIDAKRYLDDYINSYIERDVVLAAGIQKSREFLFFIKLLAGRTGQLVDFSALANESDVDSKTAKDWISILEKMHIIALVQPFHSNLSKRLTKAPKLYFIDTGLACRLQGWTSSEAMLTSPQQGHLFETLVFSEILKTKQNYLLDWNVFHWRTKDGEEIDFLLELGSENFCFIESKVSATAAFDSKKQREVLKVFKKPPPVLICHQEGEESLANRIPVAQLKNTLLKMME